MTMLVEQSAPGTVELRPARLDEVAALEALDRLCFTTDAPESEAAAPDELHQGVLAGRVTVAVENGRPGEILGFVQHHIDRASGVAYIAGLAVHPARWRQGIGRRLFDQCLSDLAKDHGIVQVTLSVAPQNVTMMRLACAKGFVGTHYVADYYGSGHPRIIFANSGLHAQLTSAETMFVPHTSETALTSRLDGATWQLAGVRDFPHGAMFELQRFSANERAAMMANEASVSVSFSAVIIAALAVLAGFGFNKSNFPPALIAQMILAIIVTLIGLIIYANSTGELSELDFRCVNRYMQIGNIVTEFGGVYPMLHVLPVSIAVITADRHVGVATALAAFFAALAYQWSEFGILRRYKRPDARRLTLADAWLAASPVVGYCVWFHAGGTGWWSMGNSAVLLAIGIWCTRRLEQAAAAARRSTEH